MRVWCEFFGDFLGGETRRGGGEGRTYAFGSEGFVAGDAGAEFALLADCFGVAGGAHFGLGMGMIMIMIDEVIGWWGKFFWS